MAEKPINDLGHMNSDVLSEFNIDVEGPKNTLGRAVAAPVKGVASIIGKTATGAYKGVTNELQNKFPNTVGLASDAFSVVNDIKQLKNDVVQEITPAWNTLKGITLKMMPMTKALMPKSIYQKIEKKLKDSYQPEDERSEEQKLKESRDENIAQQLQAVFSAQMELQQASEAKATAEKQTDRLLEKTRFQADQAAFASLDKKLQAANNFLNGAFTAYLKKSLELKYRHLYVANDTFQTLKILTKITEARLEEIKHNTGLPEYAKVTMKERLIGSMKQKTVDSVVEFGSKIQEKFFSNLKESIMDKVQLLTKNLIPMLASQADLFSDPELMGGPIRKSSIIGTPLGWIAQMFMGKKVSQRLNKNIHHINDLEKLMGYARQNFPFMLKDFVDKYKNSDNGLFRFAANLMPTMQESVTVDSQTLMKDPNAVVPFDVSTRAAIVEIIPAHLERIGDYVEGLTNSVAPGAHIESKVFNSVTRQITSKSQARKDVVDAIVDPELMKYYQNEVLSTSMSIRDTHKEDLEKSSRGFEYFTSDDFMKLEKKFQSNVASFNSQFMFNDIREYHYNNKETEWFKKAFSGFSESEKEGMCEYFVSIFENPDHTTRPYEIGMYQNAMRGLSHTVNYAAAALQYRSNQGDASRLGINSFDMKTGKQKNETIAKIINVSSSRKTIEELSEMDKRRLKEFIENSKIRGQYWADQDNEKQHEIRMQIFNWLPDGLKEAANFIPQNALSLSLLGKKFVDFATKSMSTLGKARDKLEETITGFKPIKMAAEYATDAFKTALKGDSVKIVDAVMLNSNTIQLTYHVFGLGDAQKDHGIFTVTSLAYDDWSPPPWEDVEIAWKRHSRSAYHKLLTKQEYETAIKEIKANREKESTWRRPESESTIRESIWDDTTPSKGEAAAKSATSTSPTDKLLTTDAWKRATIIDIPAKLQTIIDMMHDSDLFIRSERHGSASLNGKDSTLIRANDGELVLTLEQQKRVMEIFNATRDQEHKIQHQDELMKELGMKVDDDYKPLFAHGGRVQVTPTTEKGIYLNSKGEYVNSKGKPLNRKMRDAIKLFEKKHGFKPKAIQPTVEAKKEPVAPATEAIKPVPTPAQTVKTIKPDGSHLLEPTLEKLYKGYAKAKDPEKGDKKSLIQYSRALNKFSTMFKTFSSTIFDKEDFLNKFDMKFREKIGKVYDTTVLNGNSVKNYFEALLDDSDIQNKNYMIQTLTDAADAIYDPYSKRHFITVATQQIMNINDTMASSDAKKRSDAIANAGEGLKGLSEKLAKSQKKEKGWFHKKWVQIKAKWRKFKRSPIGRWLSSLVDPKTKAQMKEDFKAAKDSITGGWKEFKDQVSSAFDPFRDSKKSADEKTETKQAEVKSETGEPVAAGTSTTDKPKKKHWYERAADWLSNLGKDKTNGVAKEPQTASGGSGNQPPTDNTNTANKSKDEPPKSEEPKKEESSSSDSKSSSKSGGVKPDKELEELFKGEPESKFHSDFRIFATRLITLVKHLRSGLGVEVVRNKATSFLDKIKSGIQKTLSIVGPLAGGVLRGAGAVVGGLARGAGSVFKGIMKSKVIESTVSGAGSVVGGLVRGAGSALHGGFTGAGAVVKGLSNKFSDWILDKKQESPNSKLKPTKYKGVYLNKDGRYVDEKGRFVKDPTKNGTPEEEEKGTWKSLVSGVKSWFSLSEKPKYVDIYLRDKIELGKPLLSAKQQEEGVTFEDGSKVESSADIDKPVFMIDPATKKRKCMITETDIKHGLVDSENKPITKGLKGVLDGILDKAGWAGKALKFAGKVGKGLVNFWGDLLGFGKNKDEAKGGRLSPLGKLLGIDGKEFTTYHSNVLTRLDQMIVLMGGTPPKEGEEAKPEEEQKKQEEKKSEDKKTEEAKEATPAKEETVKTESVKNESGEEVAEGVAKSEKKGKAELTPTEYPGVYKNKAGKYVDEKGRFVKDPTKQQGEEAEEGDTAEQASAEQPEEKKGIFGKIIDFFKKKKDDGKKEEKKKEDSTVSNLEEYNKKRKQEAEEKKKKQAERDAVNDKMEQAGNQRVRRSLFNGYSDKPGYAIAQQRIDNAYNKALDFKDMAMDWITGKADPVTGRRTGGLLRGSKAKALRFLRNNKVARRWGGKYIAKFVNKPGATSKKLANLAWKGTKKFGAKAGSWIARTASSLAKSPVASAAMSGVKGLAMKAVAPITSSIAAAGGVGPAMAALATNPITLGILGAAVAGYGVYKGVRGASKENTKKNLGIKEGVQARDRFASGISQALTLGFGGKTAAKLTRKAIDYVPGVGLVTAIMGDKDAMTDKEINKFRKKCEVKIKRGMKAYETILAKFNKAVRMEDWPLARSISGNETNLVKNIVRAFPQTAIIYDAAVLTKNILFGNNDKPMTAEEIKGFQKKIQAQIKKSGGKNKMLQDLLDKFNDAVYEEDWKKARALSGKKAEGLLNGKSAGRNIGMIAGAALGPLGMVAGALIGDLFDDPEKKPLSKKEIEETTKFLTKQATYNPKAKDILKEFQGAVESEDWKTARKLSGKKAEHLITKALKTTRTIAKFTSPIGWFIALHETDQSKPMTEKEIQDYRSKMQFRIKKGDGLASRKLEAFDEAIAQQNWEKARKISKTPDKSAASKIRSFVKKITWDWIIGNNEKPMTEAEQQKFRDSMQRKIKMGDNRAQRKLEAFEDAVGNQKWERARKIADMPDDGWGTKAVKAVGSWVAGLFGSDSQAMSELDIKKFRDKMNDAIKAGDKGAQRKLDKFEDAVADQNWKRARAIADMPNENIVSKAAKTAYNFLWAGDQDSAMTDAEVEKFEIEMNKKIKEGDPNAQKLLDQFHEAVSNGLWEKARRIANVKKDGLLKSAGKTALKIATFGLFGKSDKTADDVVKMQEELEEKADDDETGLWQKVLDRFMSLKNQGMYNEAYAYGDKMMSSSLGELKKNAAENKNVDEMVADVKIKKRQQDVLANIQKSMDKVGWFSGTEKKRNLGILYNKAKYTDNLSDEFLDEIEDELQKIDEDAEFTKGSSSYDVDKGLKKMMMAQAKLRDIAINTREKVSFWKHPFDWRNIRRLVDELTSTTPEELTDEKIGEWNNRLASIDGSGVKKITKEDIEAEKQKQAEEKAKKDALKSDKEKLGSTKKSENKATDQKTGIAAVAGKKTTQKSAVVTQKKEAIPLSKDKKKIETNATLIGDTLVPIKGETREAYEERYKKLSESYEKMSGKKIYNIFTPEGRQRYVAAKKLAAAMSDQEYSEESDPVLLMLSGIPEKESDKSKSPSEIEQEKVGLGKNIKPEASDKKSSYLKQQLDKQKAEESKDPSSVASSSKAANSGVGSSSTTTVKGTLIGNTLVPIKGETREEYEKRLEKLQAAKSKLDPKIRLKSIFTEEGRKSYISMQNVRALMSGEKYSEETDPVLLMLNDMPSKKETDEQEKVAAKAEAKEQAQPQEKKPSKFWSFLKKAAPWALGALGGAAGLAAVGGTKLAGYLGGKMVGLAKGAYGKMKKFGLPLLGRVKGLGSSILSGGLSFGKGLFSGSVNRLKNMTKYGLIGLGYSGIKKLFGSSSSENPEAGGETGSPISTQAEGATSSTASGITGIKTKSGMHLPKEELIAILKKSENYAQFRSNIADYVDEKYADKASSAKREAVEVFVSLGWKQKKLLAEGGEASSDESSSDVDFPGEEPTTSSSSSRVNGTLIADTLVPVKGETREEYEKRLKKLQEARKKIDPDKVLYSIFTDKGRKRYTSMKSVISQMQGTSYSEKSDPVLALVDEMSGKSSKSGSGDSATTVKQQAKNATSSPASASDFNGIKAPSGAYLSKEKLKEMLMSSKDSIAFRSKISDYVDESYPDLSASSKRETKELFSTLGWKQKKMLTGSGSSESGKPSVENPSSASDKLDKSLQQMSDASAVSLSKGSTNPQTRTDQIDNQAKQASERHDKASVVLDKEQQMIQDEATNYNAEESATAAQTEVLGAKLDKLTNAVVDVRDATIAAGEGTTERINHAERSAIARSAAYANSAVEQVRPKPKEPKLKPASIDVTRPVMA